MTRIPLHATVWLLCVLMAGCAYLSVPTPKTFNSRALAATQGATTAVATSTVLLNARKIGSDDAENIQKQADNLKDGVVIARQVHALNPQAGGAKLDAIEAALTALEAYLAAREKQ